MKEQTSQSHCSPWASEEAVSQAGFERAFGRSMALTAARLHGPGAAKSLKLAEPPTRQHDLLNH